MKGQKWSETSESGMKGQKWSETCKNIRKNTKTTIFPFFSTFFETFRNFSKLRGFSRFFEPKFMVLAIGNVDNRRPEDAFLLHFVRKYSDFRHFSKLEGVISKLEGPFRNLRGFFET